MESSSEFTSSVSSDIPNLDNSGDLRFPIPAADSRITTWVQSITRKTMAHDGVDVFDEGILGESAYELIDTDDESRDDYATESVASTDYCRSVDVTSLVNTECHEDSYEEDIQDSCDPTLLENDLEEPLNTPSINHCPCNKVGNIEVPLFSCFEFDEFFDESSGTFYIKHVVAELDEDQTTSALSLMHFDNRPKKVVLSVRQTMTKLSLCTKDPLRILFVGSHSAKQDIIHKIASTVIASVEDTSKDQRSRYPGSQHFNVVPISAFGSERAPEIELMHSSRYQIKIDSCYSAQKIESKENPGSPDVIKLVLDDNCAYFSVPLEKDCYTVEPAWELPHITVIYISNDDDMTIRNTTTIVREFMKRHNIPSIVISQKLMLDLNPIISLDQHPIHLCLDSRDPIRGEEIIHRRLPIDLASFLNIDVRQMNRNIAYITGLYKPSNGPITAKPDLNKNRTPVINDRSVKKAGPLSWHQLAHKLGFVYPYRVFLMGSFIALMIVISSYSSVSGPKILLNNKSILTDSNLSITSRYNILSPKVFITSSTYTSLRSSAQYIPGSYNSSLSPNEDSCPAAGEFIKERASIKMKIFPNFLACTAEIYTDQEMIIRITSAINLSIPKNEVISLSIMRDNLTIDTDEAYRSGNVFILVISTKEAYGIVNISINTLKNPTILNETCTLDFRLSASHFWQLLKNKMSTIITQEYEIDKKYLRHIRKAINGTDSLFSESRLNIHKISNVYSKAIKRMSSVSNKFNGSAIALTLKSTKKIANLSQKLDIQGIKAKKLFKKVKKPIYKSIFLAQLQSKTLWLKLQGLEEEGRKYREKAIAVGRGRK